MAARGGRAGGISLERFADRNTPWKSQKREKGIVQKQRLRRIKAQLEKQRDDGSDYFERVLAAAANEAPIAPVFTEAPARDPSPSPSPSPSPAVAAEPISSPRSKTERGSTSAGRRPDRFKAEREAFEKQQEERARAREEAERQRQEREAGRANASKRRKTNRAVMTRKTSRGQPALNGMVSLLLDRIQQEKK